MARVAFVGLGVMGAPMAGHLVAAGHEVTVWNRGAERAAAWGAEHPGAAVAPTAAAAAAAADVVLMCVGNDASVLDVVAGPDGILDGAAPGLVRDDDPRRWRSAPRELESAGVAGRAAFALLERGVGAGTAEVAAHQRPQRRKIGKVRRQRAFRRHRGIAAAPGPMPWPSALRTPAPHSLRQPLHRAAPSRRRQPAFPAIPDCRAARMTRKTHPCRYG